MPWMCPICGGANNDASLRCPCGYETQDALVSKKKTKSLRPRGFTVLAFFFIVLVFFAVAGVKSTAPTNTLINKLFNAMSAIFLLSTSIGLLRFKIWTYKSFKVSVGIFIIQSIYLLFIVERKFLTFFVVIFMCYIAIFYFIGKYIKRSLTNLNAT